MFSTAVGLRTTFSSSGPSESDRVHVPTVYCIHLGWGAYFNLGARLVLRLESFMIGESHRAGLSIRTFRRD